MPAFAPGEARRLTAASGTLAASLLVLCVALGGCAARDPHALAAAEDRTHGTKAFTWLVEHEPSSVVGWNVTADALQALLPRAVVSAAHSERPCAQAARAHAALVLLAAAGPRREYALNCGFSLYRDAAAVVVAPLP